jgi:hypothetical protein
MISSSSIRESKSKMLRALKTFACNSSSRRGHKKRKQKTKETPKSLFLLKNIGFWS